MGEQHFWKELFALLPFYLLHLNLGVSYCFGSPLIEHYKQIYSESVKEGDDIIVTLLGTLDLIGPICIAPLGGFVQQLVGPKKMLIVNGVASCAGWVFMILGTNSIPCLLLNRVAGGVGIGILMGNVYLPDTVSPQFLASFKMIEFVAMQLGCIIMFFVMMLLKTMIGVQWVSAIFLGFPALGLIGVFISKESPVFLARQEMKANEEKSEDSKSSWLQDTLQSLKIPLFSPSVYKPLFLAASLGSLGSIAGDTYITKFLVQIINPQTQESAEIPQINNSSLGLPPPSISANSTRSVSPRLFTTMLLSNASSVGMDGTMMEDTVVDGDQAAYTASLIIQFAKLIVVLMMSFLLRRWRARFLYFSSLIFTVSVLICLAFLCDESFSFVFFSPSVVLYIKTVLLCLHATVTQLGMQTFPGLLTDVIYPTSYQAVLKGMTVSIECIAFVVMIFCLKIVSYSQAFFIMAGILLLVSPLLYMFVPEVKNMGGEMSAEFFVPFQTVFYFVLPENKKGSEEVRAKAIKNWKTGLRKVSAMSIWATKAMKEQETKDFVRKYPTITIDEQIPSVESTVSDDKSRKLNVERVSYISNILSQAGYLCQNQNDLRVLVGRGPVKMKGKKGSMFLFTDVILVAKRLVSGRRYVGELSFKLDSASFTLERKVSEIFLNEEEKEPLAIEFEDESLAIVWEKYINSFKNTVDEKVEHKKNVSGALEMMGVRKNAMVEEARDI